MTNVYRCSDRQERERALGLAATLINRGGVVLAPADSSYALIADAFNPDAVGELLKLKGRDRSSVVPVLVASSTTVSGLVYEMDSNAHLLMDAFWPGELTLILRSAPTLAWDLGATLGTVSVRMPSSALLLELLERTGPVAAMSANRLGLPAPTSLAQAEQVLGELESLDLILDDGELTPSPPSSIVDLTSSTPTLVRAGGVTVDQIRAVISDLVVLE